MNKKIFSLWNTFTYKNILLFTLIIALPNLLGMVNINVGMGFKIHLFQLGIFVAAMAYGPLGGMLAGVVGSIYSAMIMSNPYLILGNALLGFVAGYLMRLEWNAVAAVAVAFIIQLPWLVLSDYYFMSMPFELIMAIVIALAVSNMLWAIIIQLTKKQLKNFI